MRNKLIYCLHLIRFYIVYAYACIWDRWICLIKGHVCEMRYINPSLTQIICERCGRRWAWLSEDSTVLPWDSNFERMSTFKKS